MKVFLTGATGLVGGAVLRHLSLKRDIEVLAAVRKNNTHLPISDRCRCVELDDLGSKTHVSQAVAGIDCVVHAAARVHVVSDTVSDPLAEFRQVNVVGTLNVARQASAAGVRRFIFISSIKVNGETTVIDKPFFADDAPAPLDPYGISKMEAEQGLMTIAEQTGMEVVIIRPPLVYGPGVKANFLSMMRWLYRSVPLPLGAIHNQRSLVGLDNLVDLIITCIDHPRATNQVFLAGDGEDISTTELLRRMGQTLGKPAKLIPVSASLLQAGATLLGRRDMGQRLCESLQVDITKTRELLGWSPPVSMDEGLQRTAEHFLLSCLDHRC